MEWGGAFNWGGRREENIEEGGRKDK